MTQQKYQRDLSSLNIKELRADEIQLKTGVA